MKHPGFYEKAGPFSLAEVAEACGASLADTALADKQIDDVLPLDDAGGNHISFIDNRKYLPQLDVTKAGACFVAEKFAGRVPENTIALVSPQPYHSFAKALFLFYPDAGRPATWGRGSVDTDGPLVHPSAQIEEGATIEPGAVIGPEAEIGSGTRIAAGAFIGYRVHIGRDCYIGPGSVLTHSLIGNKVNIHAGVKIGQDGFGFAMGPQGHLKVPQIGRVIIQDDVEIGANTTIDRGAVKDTMIGEGTKIDNLVQIGHNVIIGRHCVIVAQSGISGSTELGDFVVMGGQSATVGHLKVGTGVQIAGGCALTHDADPGTKWGGKPARPFKQWARELAALKQLAMAPKKKADN